MTVYHSEPDLDADDFIAVLLASGLAARRPVGDRARVGRMLAEASVIVTARDDHRLVGIARGLTDHSFCLYLSDLAVDQRWQGHGIGRELIHRAHAEAGPDVTQLILLAAPDAETYYPHIGLRHFPQCYVVDRHAVKETIE